MSNSAAELDQSIFGFIDALSGLSDSAAVVDALHRALAMEGVRFFCFNFLPQPGESFEDVVLANRWPQDWLRLYVAENYVQDDPAIRYCRRMAQPFEWSAAPFDPMREPRAAEIVERAKDFGLADGYVTPVPSPSGSLGSVWVAGQRAFGARAKAAIHLTSLYAFDRLRALKAPSCRQQTEPDDARARGAELDRVGKVGLGDRRDPCDLETYGRRAYAGGLAQARRGQPRASRRDRDARSHHRTLIPQPSVNTTSTLGKNDNTAARRTRACLPVCRNG